jgi:hypothetical protein
LKRCLAPGTDEADQNRSMRERKRVPAKMKRVAGCEVRVLRVWEE